MSTIACEDRDFLEWHGGARHVLIWAALVDTEEVTDAVASARAHWAEVLLPRYERQPHVTLSYGGPVPLPGGSPADPIYSPQRLAEDHATLNGLRMSPFDVRIGEWETFPMVPYLKAEAPELRQIAASLNEGRRHPYVPHVTLGHYAVEVPLTQVRALAASWTWPEVSVRVDRLSLLRYDAADIAGPLLEVDCVELRGSSTKSQPSPDRAAREQARRQRGTSSG